MIKHDREKQNPINPCRYWYMGRTKSRWKTDGLATLNYKRLKLEKRQLYTWILVDLLEEKAKEIMKKENLCH